MIARETPPSGIRPRRLGVSIHRLMTTSTDWFAHPWARAQDLTL